MQLIVLNIDVYYIIYDPLYRRRVGAANLWPGIGLQDDIERRKRKSGLCQPVQGG